MEGFLLANLLFFLVGIFLDLYLYLCSHKYRILVEYIHESYQRHTICVGFLFHFWAGSVFFHHFIAGRFFSFRSTFLSLGDSFGSVNHIRIIFRLWLSVEKKGFGSCVCFEPVEGVSMVVFREHRMKRI